MPIGDTVCAAKGGYIAGIVEKHNKNGTDKSYRKFANFITMYHEDGTYSQYVHLKKNGALVSVNQYVKQGEPIGLSGNTGWSTEPHLHFAVFKSIPIILNGQSSLSFKKHDVPKHSN